MSNAPAESMPLRIKHERLVRAPLEVVWAAKVDLTRQPEWQPRVRSVEVLSPGPVGVGTRYRMQLRAGFRRHPIEVEVIEMEPMRVFTHRAHYPTHKFTTLDRTELNEVDDGVMMTFSSFFLEADPVLLAFSRMGRSIERWVINRVEKRFVAVVEQG